MEMETNGVDPRNKAAWLSKARDRFGPGVELARVSSKYRNSRFVIALGAVKLDARSGYSPVVLGGGDSYESAMADSERSETGRIAAEQWSKYVADMMVDIEKANKENDDYSKSASRTAGEAADGSSGGNDHEGPGEEDGGQR